MQSVYLSPLQLIASAPAVIVTTPVLAATDGLPDFLAHGSILVDVRDRHEDVEQNGLASDAAAHMTRVRLGYQTDAFRNLKPLIELEGTEHLSKAFSDTGASALCWRQSRFDGAIDCSMDHDVFLWAFSADRCVRPLDSQDSAAQKSLADADVLVRIRSSIGTEAVEALLEILDL